MMRRCLSLLLAVILVLSMGTCAFASDTEEPAPVPVQEIVEVTPEPEEEPAPVPVQEVVEVTPEPEIATEPEDVSEVEETTAEVEETTVVEETTIQEEVEEEEVGERLLPIYFWVDPLTGVCHSGLTYEQCIALIQEWIHSHPDLVLLNTAPTKDGDAAPAPGYTVKEEAAAPAESDAAPAEEAADYHVKFTVGEKEVEFAGGKDVSLTELLAALGIEVPEGAEVALDNSSVDTDVLTVAEKDGETVLNSKGAFFAAGKPLVVLIDGVPTEINVTDDMSGAEFMGIMDTSSEKKLTLNANAKVTSTVTVSTGEYTIDLNEKTLESSAADAAFEITGDAKVTFLNGTIDAAGNAIKVAGNAVVNFFNVAINAVKQVLHISENAEVTVDKDSELTSKGKDDADTVMMDVTSDSKAQLTVDSTVVNEGTGSAVAVNETAASNEAGITLGWNALLKTKDTTANVNEKAIGYITSHGAVFSDGDTANALVAASKAVKLDANYDCADRIRVVTEVKDLGTPTRPGYRFLGWNSEPDGSGKSYTISGAMKAGVDTLYAMWENLNYYWLIPAVARPNGYEVFIATRMNVSDGVAKITFEDAKGNFLAPDSVGYKDVKNIINRGAKIARMQLDETLFFEMNLKDIAAAGGKNVNTLKFFYEDGFVTVVSGQKVLFSVETALLDKATKDDVTLSFDEDGLVVKYGKATAFTIPMADLGENILLALKGDKLTAISISGLDVTKYGATKVSLADALAKGPIVKEYSK